MTTESLLMFAQILFGVMLGWMGRGILCCVTSRCSKNRGKQVELAVHKVSAVDTLEPLHPLEQKVWEAEPNLGEGDVSMCLPGWIKTLCQKFEAHEGYQLSDRAVGNLAHTLIAARLRNARLVNERDAATGGSWQHSDWTECEMNGQRYRCRFQYSAIERVDPAR